MLYIDDVDCLAYSNGQEILYVDDPRDVLFILAEINSNYPFRIVGGKIAGLYKYEHPAKLVRSDGYALELVNKPAFSTRGKIITVLVNAKIPPSGYLKLKKGPYVFNLSNENINTLLYSGRTFCDENLKMIYSSGPLL